MFSRIVVPLDGSVLAERALAEAEELARLSGAAVHVVRAVDPTHIAKVAGSPVYGMYKTLTAFQQLVENERAAAENYLETTKASLTARGLTTTAHLLQGDCASEIVADTKPGDVIVMATHGRGGLPRLFLGSVAEDVARHSDVPVMLIRTGPAAVPAVVVASAEDLSTSLAMATI